MRNRPRPRIPFIPIVATIVIAPQLLQAQLVDDSQISHTVPLGTIAKSLEQQIGTGRGDNLTPQSSTYLIERDPARSIRRGRQLFQRKFTTAQGVGPRVNATSTGNVSTHPALGAGLSDSCAACHGRPRGSAGFGGVVATRPDSRDAPHLFGLGLQEMIADEMTQELRNIQYDAIRKAIADGRPARARLRSKGVDFGTITARPDSFVELDRVHGIDDDLRVRPFFAQGGGFSIREFIVGAFKDEMGLECADPDLAVAAAGGAVTTPSGLVLDGEYDTFNAPPVDSTGEDGDGDGVINEVDPSLVDHLEFYLLNYFKPGTGKRSRTSDRGKKILHSAGCTKCHIPDFTIENDRRVADVETVYDPRNGIFNHLFATAETRFEVVEDGEEFPRLVPAGERFKVKNIYTDFKRHDLGEAFHERNYDGSITREFMTEPLWGVGSTPPYGHDGRSINLEEVILRHGGEAKESRERFKRLRDQDRAALIAFLNTLVLFPPDDTASNLNPGNKEGNPQDPANHGNINLGALFQIPDPDGLGE